MPSLSMARVLRGKKDFLAVAVFLTVVAVGCAGGEEVRIHPVDKVVLVSVDTLRKDYLGVYNDVMPTSPHLDRFASESFVFTDAMAQSTSTLPSHTALLYSIQTFIHRAYVTGWPDPRVTSPVEAIKQAGFATAAFVGGGQMDPQFGLLTRGFDRYEVINTLDVKGGWKGRDRLGKLMEATAGFLRQHRDDSFLLLLHNYEPHFDYDPPEDLLRKYQEMAAELDAAGIDEAEPLVGDNATLAAFLANERRVNYAALVEYVDQFVGALLQELEALGIDEQTAIVFTADHGDSHGERGKNGHGTYFEEVVKVPLIIHVPGADGERIDAPVQLVDVMPTLFKLLRLEPPYPFMGQDLVPLMRGRRDVIPADRVRFSENKATSAPESTGYGAIMRNEWKLLYDLDDLDAIQLFNLELDPGEVRDFSEDNVRIVSSLTAEYQRHVRENEHLRALFPHGDFDLDDLDSATIEQLRALGYIR